MRFSILISFLLFSAVLLAGGKIDSVSFFPDGNLRYVHETYEGRISEYWYHENGRLKTLESKYENESYELQRYSENGTLLFDTTYSKDYYLHASTYYPDGAKKTFYQLKLKQQSNDSPILSQYIAWDEHGELSYYREIDTSGRVAADEAYPWRKYQHIRFKRDYYPDGSLKTQGLYKNVSSCIAFPGENDEVKYGVWYEFFQNRQLKCAGLFIDGKPWGLHYEYDSTGKLLSLNYFINGIQIKNEPGNSVLPFNAPVDKDTMRMFQWNKFAKEGLYSYGNSYSNEANHAYYFHGGPLAFTPDPSPEARKKEKRLVFCFPPGDVWCTWGMYTITIDEKGNLLSIAEGLSENFRSYYPNGVLKEWKKSNARTTYSYNSNGTIARIERDGQLRTPFTYHYTPVIFPIDTIREYDGMGRIVYMTIYGTRGQIIKRMTRQEDSVWIVTANPMYQHFYILLGGKWTEIKDHDATFTGEWRFVCENGNFVSEGPYDGGKNGMWKTYNPQTGKLLLEQYYEDDKPVNKGIYRRYDDNGSLAEKGQYDEKGRQTGVWKTYNHGKCTSRNRLVKGNAYGFGKCTTCCANKNGKRRNAISFSWNGKTILQLPKCREHYIEHDDDRMERGEAD